VIFSNLGDLNDFRGLNDLVVFTSVRSGTANNSLID